MELLLCQFLTLIFNSCFLISLFIASKNSSAAVIAIFITNITQLNINFKALYFNNQQYFRFSKSSALYCIREMQSWWGEPEQVVKNCHYFHMLNSIEKLTRTVNLLLSNHGNQHLDITYQPWNRGSFGRVMFTKISTTIIMKINHNQDCFTVHFP